MDESDAYNVVQLYRNLEEQILEFKKYIPPTGTNLLSWSPRLATVIIEACGMMDSIFRQLSPAELKIGKKRVRRNNFTIRHFYRIYQDFALQDKKIILLSSPPEYCSPFAGWTANTSPDWWQTYNQLKHDRVAHMQEATFETAIEALAGLLIVLAFSRNASITTALNREDFLDYRLNPEIVFEWASRGYPQSGGVSLQSSLFAMILTSDPLPARIENFRPALFNASSRLITFFGRM